MVRKLGASLLFSWLFFFFPVLYLHVEWDTHIYLASKFSDYALLFMYPLLYDMGYTLL